MKNKNLTNFLFEAATLKRLQRTGWQILGGGNKESIAEHSFMVCVISYVLSGRLKADSGKALKMALFHDFCETRVGDIYKLADLYLEADVIKAAKDSFSNLADDGELFTLFKEYEKEETLEAKIVHDADTIALILELKQLIENGNLNAYEWFDGNIKSLNLTLSKEMAEEIKKTNSQDWWKKERKTLHRLLKDK